MKSIFGWSVVAAVAGAPVIAEKFYGELINAASGAALPAAFELIDASTLDYCFNDLEANCWELPYELLDAEVIQARLIISRKSNGVVKQHANIWTFTPIDGGYHGTFEIQYEDARPEMQTEGDFFPKQE